MRRSPVRRPLAPDYRDHVPLVVYRVRTGSGRLQAIRTKASCTASCTTDWDGRGRDSILTASFSGIHRYWLEDGKWSREQIAKRRSRRVAALRCERRRRRADLGRRTFLAAIEPWHGNQVAVYRRSGAAWARTVIETGLPDSHSIAAADFDGDGASEIVVAQRGKPGRVVVFSMRNTHWEKKVVDEGITAASCAVADLNGDRRPDLACIGSATENLKWYENLGAK